MDADDSPSMLLVNGPNQYHVYLAWCPNEDNDGEIMEKTKQILGDNNLSVYPSTENRKNDIDNGILRSRKVVVIASQAYLESPWCAHELSVIKTKIDSLSEGTVHVIFTPGMERQKLPTQLQGCRYLGSDDSDFVAKLCAEVKTDIHPRFKPVTPKPNLGACFCYAYWQGYLKIILKDMRDRILKSPLGNGENDPQKRNICPRFVVIVPESCYGPPVLDQISDAIKVEGAMPYSVDRGGIKARSYKSTVYRIHDDKNDRDYLFAGEVPSILVNMYEMAKGEEFVFARERQVQEMQQFYYHLACLLNDPQNADMKDQISLIYYSDADGRQDNLPELILQNIQNEILKDAIRIQNEVVDEINPETEQEGIVPASAQPGILPTLQQSQGHIAAETTELYIPSYPMKSRPRGQAIIINCATVDVPDNGTGPMGQSLGAGVDEQIMSDLLKELYFDVEVFRDLTSSKILDTVATYSGKQRHKDFDAFACVLIGHGRLGAIFGKDGNAVNIISDVAELFANCPSLKGKPKFFFVQATQAPAQSGNTPAPIAKENRKRLAAEMNGLQTDANTNPRVVQKNGPVKSLVVPGHPDFLMSYAALPGATVPRSADRGSLYIRVLADEVRRYKGELEFEHILKRVTTKVRENLPEVTDDSNPGHLEVPVHFSTMEQLVYWK